MSRILVTGATGYVGGRLVRRLINAGHQVRCLARNPERLERRFGAAIEVAHADLADSQSLIPAIQGCEIVYYLVHAMAGDEQLFEERDRLWASNFATAASAAGCVKRIIYLGGLGDDTVPLSRHLRSRHEVGNILRECGIPVTEFRAAVIIGSGSASFEIIRYLTERLPVMICPKWVNTRCQPIAMADVQRYLMEALTTPESTGTIVEIGGADVLTYGDMIRGYAAERRLHIHRVLIPVPVLSPRLSSYWVDLVTPLPASIARPLIEGLESEVVVRDDTARRLFSFNPMSYREAVRRALMRLNNDEIETSWFDAVNGELETFPYDKLRQQDGMLVERRTSTCGADATALFEQATRIGGSYGWPYLDILFYIRAVLDRLVGGPGMRRGRRSMTDLRCGDAVDFWRVEKYEPGHLILLRAEMKMPGSGWLQFEVVPCERGSRLVQTAFFDPCGLAGLCYWYMLYPMHQILFGGMVKEIARKAEARRLTTTSS